MSIKTDDDSVTIVQYMHKGSAPNERLVVRVWETPLAKEPTAELLAELNELKGTIAIAVGKLLLRTCHASVGVHLVEVREKFLRGVISPAESSDNIFYWRTVWDDMSTYAMVSRDLETHEIIYSNDPDDLDINADGTLGIRRASWFIDHIDPTISTGLIKSFWLSTNQLPQNDFAQYFDQTIILEELTKDLIIYRDHLATASIGDDKAHELMQQIISAMKSKLTLQVLFDAISETTSDSRSMLEYSNMICIDRANDRWAYTGGENVQNYLKLTMEKLQHGNSI